MREKKRKIKVKKMKWDLEGADHELEKTFRRTVTNKFKAKELKEQ